MPRFLNQLTNSLAEHSIPASFVELNDDSLDNDSLVEDAAKRFRPGQLLRWRLAQYNTISSRSQMSPGDMPEFRSGTSVSLEFSVIDVWVNKIVWRARFSFGTSPTPEMLAAQLLEELTKAGLLVQQSPQQNR